MFNFCIFTAYRLRLNLKYIAIFLPMITFMLSHQQVCLFMKVCILLTEQLAQLFNNFAHFYSVEMIANYWLLVATSARAIISYPY